MRIGQVMKPSLKYNAHRDMRQGANILASMRNNNNIVSDMQHSPTRDAPSYHSNMNLNVPSYHSNMNPKLPYYNSNIDLNRNSSSNFNQKLI